MKIIGFALVTVLCFAYACWAWGQHFEFEAIFAGFLALVGLITVLREAQHRRCA